MQVRPFGPRMGLMITQWTCAILRSTYDVDLTQGINRHHQCAALNRRKKSNGEVNCQVGFENSGSSAPCFSSGSIRDGGGLRRASSICAYVRIVSDCRAVCSANVAGHYQQPSRSWIGVE
ncbi:hypothetical protein LIA77_10556 [Sarocladium implicatum]|nr:hypothetical protein LIA77_10556 [Sarocladium implicatum]